MTDKEIAERAKEAEKRTGFGELVHSPISKGVNSAYGIGFIEGMVEYRKSLQEETVSEDLDEAAWQYYDRNKPLMPPELDLHKELIDFFKAGARWKEQNDSNLSEVLVRDNLYEMAEEYSSCTYLEEVLGEEDREVLKARLKNTFKAGAKWQKKQFEKDYADLCNGIVTAKGIAVAMAYDNGVADAKKQIMAKAIDVTVHIDAGGYPCTPEIELYDYDKDVPLAKEGDKYKVVLIKED